MENTKEDSAKPNEQIEPDWIELIIFLLIFLWSDVESNKGENTP